MRVTVHGAQFPSSQDIRVVLAPGDSNSDTSVCQSTVATVGSATVNSSGQFSITFEWPTAAGQVNGKYSVCSYIGTTDSIQSTTDDGPFTVLANTAPKVSSSPTTDVKPSTTVTISGQNWVPPQPVKVAITAASGGQRLVAATASSQGQNAGTFSVRLTIPSDAPPGKYIVAASAKGDVLTAADSAPISVIAAVPPTTPTAAPTQAPTSAPTTAPTNAPTPISTPSGATTNTTNEQNWLVFGLAITVGVLLLVLVGLLAFILGRRSPPQPPGSAMTMPPSSPPHLTGAMSQQMPAEQPYGADYLPTYYGQERARGSEPVYPAAGLYDGQTGQTPSAGVGAYPENATPHSGSAIPPDAAVGENSPRTYTRYYPQSHPLPGTYRPAEYAPRYPPYQPGGYGPGSSLPGDMPSRDGPPNTSEEISTKDGPVSPGSDGQDRP